MSVWKRPPTSMSCGSVTPRNRHHVGNCQFRHPPCIGGGFAPQNAEIRWLPDALSPGTAQESIHGVDNPVILGRKRGDGRAESVAWNIRDLKRIKDNRPVIDHKVRPNVAVGDAELFCGDKGHDDPPLRAAKAVGLDHEDKRDDPLTPAGVAMDVELLGHQRLSNSSANVARTNQLASWYE